MAAIPASRSTGGASLPVIPLMAWRNLGRRRYRTWMSVGSLAFAILLVGCGITLQAGSYVAMIKRGTELLSGQAQIQHPAWKEQPKLEYLIEDSASLAETLRVVPGVQSVAVRSQGSALVANSETPDEAGTAGMIIGVDPAAEPAMSVLPQRMIEGRYLRSGDEAVIGEALARNLDLGLGGELVVIGAALGGGTAAFVCEVVGIFDAGHPEFNRILVQVPRDLFDAAFNIEGSANYLAMRLENPSAPEATLSRIYEALDIAEQRSQMRLLGWKEVKPELYNSIRMDALSSVFIYAVIILMVGFTILGSVLMVMFERRAEFGVLMALGMRASSLRMLMHWEILWLWVLGMLIGLSLVGFFLGWFGTVGIPLPTDEQITDLMESFHMDPRMYPAYSNIPFLWIPLVLLGMAQLAVVIGMRRLGKQLPADVLRSV